MDTLGHIPMNQTTSLPKSPLRGRSRFASNRGSASLEFLLVMPAMLLIVAGLLVLGNYLMVRYHLTSAATHAARSCVVGQNTNLGCARESALAMLPASVLARCPSFSVRVYNTAIPGTTMNVFNVNLSCQYQPAIGQRILGEQGISFGSFQVNGAMPISR